MANTLEAAYYADTAQQLTVPIVSNRQVARDTFQLRLECAKIAPRITPGQFVMLRIAGVNDPLIARPLAMYNTGDTWLDVVYLVKGKFTNALSQLGAGDRLEIWGPLGNGFAPLPTEHLIMVAGGIGQTPFFALAQEYTGRKHFGDQQRLVIPPAHKITFCYGARTADYFAGLDDFASLGIDVQLSTDDGTRGHHGLVTYLLQQVLAATTLTPRIVCCGPERMMQAVSKIAATAGVSCQVSLETPMACGIGICFTCVAMICDEHGHSDYKRTCVEGPVFDANRVMW